MPRLDGDKVSTSSLRARRPDRRKASTPADIGTGQFVIGSSKVRPRIDSVFKREEKMGIYMKLYNLGADENTHKPDGQVEYVLSEERQQRKDLQFTEEISQIPDASASQVTIMKMLPLNNLLPGQYTIQLKITDKNRNQVLTPSGHFTVL